VKLISKDNLEDFGTGRVFTTVTLLQVLNAICDEKSQVFKTIADFGNENYLMGNLNLSRKRFYTRLKKLVNADLIKRTNGKYVLTEFGKVIYGLQLKLTEAVDSPAESKVIRSSGI